MVKDLLMLVLAALMECFEFKVRASGTEIMGRGTTLNHSNGIRLIMVSPVLDRLVSSWITMAGYSNDTDHRCVVVKMRVPPRSLAKFYGKKPAGNSPRLRKVQTKMLAVPDMVGSINSELHSLLVDGTFDDGYSLFGRALRLSADRHLGTIPVRQMPPWKQENQMTLAALNAKKRRVASTCVGGCSSREYNAV